jgi:protein SCO1/2
MSGPRLVRYALWGLVAIAAIVLGLLLSDALRGDDPPIAEVLQFGEPFALVSHTGDAITSDDLLGHPSLMFFGFTFCPDVCPTALAEVSGWLQELGSESGDLVVYFVTVDPERDQPVLLGEYLSVFDPTIVGITGPIDDVHAMLDGYHVFYERYESEGVGYLMDHYSSFYLLDSDGDFAGAIGYNELREDALAKIRRLVDG